MTRNRNKRNARRERNHNKADVEKVKAIFGLLAATLNHICYSTASPKPDDKPFNGIRQVSEDHIKTGVIVPADGSAVEMQIPEGFEVFISEDGKPMIHKKVEGDTAEAPKDEHDKSQMSYEDIAKKFFFKKKAYFPDGDRVLQYSPEKERYLYEDNCTTEAQAKRCFAFNKLQNIAKYLNDGWTPNFNNHEEKFYISCTGYDKYIANSTFYDNGGQVFFKSQKLAYIAISIMGKESLLDLFNTNW